MNKNKLKIQKIKWENDIDIPPQMDKWIREMLSKMMTDFVKNDLANMGVHIDLMNPDDGTILIELLDIEIPFSFLKTLDLFKVCYFEHNTHPEDIKRAKKWAELFRSYADILESGSGDVLAMSRKIFGKGDR